MIKVRIRLFSTLARDIPEHVRARYPQGIRAATPLDVEISEGSTLDDLITLLELPRQEVKVIFVNARARDREYLLSPGDEIGIFPPIGGG